VSAELPYGSWPSPISAASLIEGTVGISELVTDGGDLWWSESRPDEGGRVAIVRRSDGVVEEITPPETNVRTRVHEYGGGAWWVHRGDLFYCEFSDQRLRRMTPGEEPILLTAEPPAQGAWRFADGRASVDDRWYVCVREVHHQVPGGATLEPDNQIVAVAVDGSQELRELVLGADFYASPRPSPDGTLLAWVQWNHPNMPWDGTELWVGELEDGAVVRARMVAGGADESVSQPEWSPTSDLYFLSDRSGRSNLYRLTEDGAEVEVGGDFDVAGPMWVFGLSRYAIDDDGQVVTAMSRPKGDMLLLDGRVDGSDAVESGWSSVSAVRAFPGGAAYIGATHRADAAAIEHVDQAAYASVPHVHGVPDAFLPAPEDIVFPTSGGAEAHALYYRPAHAGHVGPPGERPPLLVLAHGGPTSAGRRQLQLSLRYWTTRGWAVVDVDYRGSTGYGRAYMDALRGQWGVADVDDCIAAATYLADRGDVDADRLAIKGGSAGGFTVLAALTFHDVFAAGASRYGIGDLEALAKDTHKFESRYLEGLVGAYPAEREVYIERSPIHHTDRLSAPMIILQGSEDKVVPPNQAEMMVDALAGKGIDHAYVLFEGEGHGFRDGANIVSALEAEYSFFAQIFGFTPADPITPVPIIGR
jgi:dipeptidyl aminopeptidase/acylaminoacyl peptidase